MLEEHGYVFHSELGEIEEVAFVHNENMTDNLNMLRRIITDWVGPFWEFISAGDYRFDVKVYE